MAENLSPIDRFPKRLQEEIKEHIEISSSPVSGIPARKILRGP
jgi:hypothetical protein